MISSAKGPFFQPKYIQTKQQAEKYLLEECDKLNITIMQPGVVVDQEHRWWSVPAKVGNDLVYNINEGVCTKVFPLAVTNALDMFIPAPSTQLATIAHFTLKGVTGENEQQVIGVNEYMKYEGRL